MNKIIDTQCECCNTDTILKIVAGNDFTLRLALTYHEDDVVKEYDLSDIQDLKVIAYSPEGVDREVDSMVDIATNRIIAVIDSYEYINYVPYGIDITWYDEPNHKRASAPNLFAFVNSSGEANDSQDVIVSGPYDYNLEIKSDIAYVSVGEIPEIDLTPYVTNSELNTTLEDYATKEYVDDELEPYINEDELGIVLENYVSNSSLSTTLEDYATKQYVDDELSNIDLSEYYTKSEVDTTLNSYGTSISSRTLLIPGPSVGMEIYLNNSDGQHLSTLTLPSFKKNIKSSVPRGWVISPETAIGFVTHDTVETIYDTVDNVNAIMSDYITSTSLNTTLQDFATLSSLDDYVTNSALNTSLNPITSDITSLDNRVTTLENNPSVPSNVVTSDDGNEIVCLTQSEYDALDQSQTLDPDVFYYITDATSNYVTNSSLTTTLNNYATKNYVDTAVSQVQPDTSNLVTINTAQTISGEKTFTAENKWTHESRFGHFNIPNNDTLMNTDIAFGVNKSGMFVRPQFLQGFIGQVLAPMNNYTNSSSGQFDIEQGVIKFQTVDSVFGQQPASLSTLAKIDSNGIYEGGTLLSDKYALKSEIPQSSGVSEEDWDNSNEAIAKELTNNRLEHLSINDNFDNYYTKTESDNRYATASWANNKFVTKTDDINRQEAIAAAFASSVQSTTVHNIWTGSQNDYDALTVKDTNTLYIIL